VVSVNNGRGEKVVEIQGEDGKKTRRSKRLTKAEIAKIRRGIFIPGLFGGGGWKGP
jgi:hypothetical protein